MYKSKERSRGRRGGGGGPGPAGAGRFSGGRDQDPTSESLLISTRTRDVTPNLAIGV